MRALMRTTIQVFAVLFLAFTASACTTSADCSNQGVCNSNSVCECNIGHLGPVCEYPNANFGYFGLNDEHLVEWLVQGSVIRTRFTWKDAGNYFSIIFEPGPDGMSSGDCWVWGLQNGVMVVQDRYSSGLNTPSKDSVSDLVLTASRVNSSYQVAESTRSFTTSEANDQQFLNQSYFLRMSWTIGNAGIPASSSSSSGHGGSKDLGMHKLLDGTGDFRIDFVGGRYEKVPDGVKWPNLYYAFAAILGASLALAVAFNALKYARSRIAQCLRANAFWEISWTEVIIWILYLAGLIAGCVASNSQYSAVGRYPSYMIGHLATIHLAFAVLPVSRHSILLRFLGIDYDRSIAWHRWVSRTAILLCWAHGFSMIQPWKFSGLFYTGDVQWGFGSIFGLGGTVLFSIAGLTALPYFRRGKYEIFLWSHRFFIPFGYFMSMLHAVQLRWLMIVPGALYIIDNLLRLATLLMGKASVLEMQQFTDGDTKATILKLANRTMFNKYSPGSFVFMYVPGVSALQWHPFSISSAASPEEDGVFTVHVLAMKPDSWTDRLHAFAGLAQQRKPADKVADGANQDPLQVSVYTEGPFSTNDLPITRFPVVVLVGGGVGITPLMSFFSYFVQQYDFAESAASKAPAKIHLIWTNRSKRALSEWFTPVIRRALSKYSKHFTIQLFFTGSERHVHSPSREIEMIQSPSRQQVRSPARPVALPGAAEEYEGEGLPSSPNNNSGKELRLEVSNGQGSEEQNINIASLIQRGRPDLPSIFAKIRDQAGVPASDVAVAVCGPHQLEKDVDKLATDLGFFCHKEGFLM